MKRPIILSTLALAAVALTFATYGCTTTQAGPQPDGRPSTVADRQALVDIAQAYMDGVQITQTMLHSAHAHGEPTTQLLAECRSAVGLYNATAAGGPWPGYFPPHLDPATECKP